MSTTPIDYEDYIDKIWFDSGDRYISIPVASYAIIPIYYQPHQIASNGRDNKLYNVATDFEAGAADADSDVTVSISTRPGYVKTTVDGAATLSLDWTTDGKKVLTNATPSTACIRSIGQYYDEPMRFLVVEVWSASDLDENDDEIIVTNLFLAHEGDDDPDSDDVFIDRSTLYNAPDDCLSAWHMHDLVARSLNALTTRCLHSQTIPLYGEGYTTVIV